MTATYAERRITLMHEVIGIQDLRSCFWRNYDNIKFLNHKIHLISKRDKMEYAIFAYYSINF